MSDLAVENTPAVAASAHEAARGQVVYITEHGERLAAIVPAAIEIPELSSLILKHDRHTAGGLRCRATRRPGAIALKP